MADSRVRILLIDDDEDDCIMLRDLLTAVDGQKFAVEWASSYEAGKKALLSREHDVCFLDYRLGAKTGLDLLKEAIADGVKTPMILLTGYGEHEVDLEAMRVGAADYLVKDQVTSLLLERSIRYSIHRRQAMQAILDREAQILVQDRLASVGLLASSLAHEIGTPLGVIRGRAEYLELQLRNDPGIKKNVDIIIAQIDRVSKLIRSLLNLARGDQMKTAGQVYLGEIVAEVIELMAHELRKHEIEIKNELVQAQSVPIAVRAEAGPLHQVLLNLLVNSVHAIETAMKGGRTTGHFIRVSVQDMGTQWALTVEDTGCGISEKNLKNLFKPFFTTKDIGVGTGLGLVTSYRIVESWGGAIQVSSVEGKGASFQILLPKSAS
ncbi:MAG: ATP-binding protein [Oligoflexia bacterium]|nr:ATP-binding protein [Oligoflexia bacterium]